MPEVVEISDSEEAQSPGQRNNKHVPPRASQPRRAGASEDDPFVIDDPGPSFHKTPPKSARPLPSTKTLGRPPGQTSKSHPSPASLKFAHQFPSHFRSAADPRSSEETLQPRLNPTLTQKSERIPLNNHPPLQQRSSPLTRSTPPTPPIQTTAQISGSCLNGSLRTAAPRSKNSGIGRSPEYTGSAILTIPTPPLITAAKKISTPIRSSAFLQSPPSKRKQQPLPNPLSALRKQTSTDVPQAEETGRQTTSPRAIDLEGPEIPSQASLQLGLSCLDCSTSDLRCDGLDPCSSCSEHGIDCLYSSNAVSKLKPSLDTVETISTQQWQGPPVIISSQTSRPISPLRTTPTKRRRGAFTDVESAVDSDSDSEHPSESDIILELEYFENLINRLVRQMREFQEYAVKPLLQQSRITSRLRNNATIPRASRNPFTALKVQSTIHRHTNAQLFQFQVKDYGSATSSVKNKWNSVAALITREQSIAPLIPKYKSIGRLRASFLAPNLTMVKYNHYDFDDENYTWTMIESKYEEVKSRYHTYDKISGILHAQRECAEHADLWRPWTERLLDQLGLDMSDIVRFYSMDGSADTHWNETIGLSDELLAKWTDEQERECESCKERYDSVRDALRNVYKTQPRASRQLALAGLACLAFHDATGLSMSHIIMTSSWTRNLLKESEGSRDTHGRSSPLMCLVCGLHNCPLHGAFQDDSGLPESFLDDLMDDVKINDSEAERNTRVIVALPAGDRLNSQSNSSKPIPKKQTTKGLKKAKTEVAKIEHRGLFIPCSHDGPCQENSACSCFKQKIPCEYICGCELTCQRRFKGCSCRTGTKEVCSNDANCECWNNSRECDPWLCKGCGVLEVLDQANRYNEEIRRGRCYNNRIQLGIPARTIKAPSEVQGFGLFAGEELEKGTFIGEYKGEIISQPESDRRGSLYPILGAEYLFTLNPAQQIDATSFGNKTRFMNNSLVAGNINVAGCVMLCNGVQRVMLYADRKIKAGEELLYNYDYPDHATKNFWERGEKAPTKRALIEAPVAKTAGTKKQQHVSQRSTPNARLDSVNEAVDSIQPPMLMRKGKRRYVDIGEVEASESDYAESHQGSEVSESDADSGGGATSSELDREISTRINKLGKPDRRFGGAAQRKAAQTRSKKLAEQLERR